MKFLVAFALVSCAIGFSSAGLSKEKLEYLKSEIISCGTKEGAAQSDVDEIMKETWPLTTHAGKCVLACTLEVGGIMKDSKVHPDGVQALTTKVYDADKGNIAKGFAEACADVTDDDRCEASVKIMECMHEKNAAAGKPFAE